MIKEAIFQYRHACEKYQYPRSCYKYGVSCIDGAEIGCESDIKKVRSRLTYIHNPRCDLQSGQSYNNSLFIHQQALHYTSRACDLGEPEGCWRNAQILQNEHRFPEVGLNYCKFAAVPSEWS